MVTILTLMLWNMKKDIINYNTEIGVVGAALENRMRELLQQQPELRALPQFPLYGGVEYRQRQRDYYYYV